MAGGVANECAPAAADVEQAFAGSEAELRQMCSSFACCSESRSASPSGKYADEYTCLGVEPKRVKIVTDVVVIRDQHQP